MKKNSVAHYLPAVLGHVVNCAAFRCATRLCSILLFGVPAVTLLYASAPGGFMEELSNPTRRAALSSSWSTGPKRVLVIRTEFPDATGETVTKAAALDLINGPVAQFFSDNSYGQTSLTATVSPLYRLPRSAAFYAKDNNSALDNDAEAAAAVDYDLEKFDRLVFIFNRSLAGYPGSIRWFGGLAAVNGERLWIHGAEHFTAFVLIHELGHTFGLMHANLWSVPDGNPVSDSGHSLEYGDPFDPMGTGADLRFHFNLAEKNNLRWLPNSAVTAVSQSGTYRIRRFDDASASLQQPLGLSILRGGSQQYWVGYRAGAAQHQALSNGAYIIWGSGPGTTSQLLDMTTPGSGSEDAALLIGRKFTDDAAGITIRPVARGGTGADQYLDVEVVLEPRNGVVIGWARPFAESAAIPADLKDVVSIACGHNHAVALKSNGTVVGWGSNDFGETTIPPGLTDVVHIAAGGHVSGAIKHDGTVVMWGSDQEGMTAVPPGLTGVRELAIGLYHALALKSDGTLVGWGKAVPHDLHLYSSIVAASAGDWSTIALRSDGTVLYWPDGRKWPPETIVAMPAELDDVIAVSAGYYHFLALRADGTVVAWGSNANGKATVPAGLTRVKSIAAGMDNSYALKDDGTLVVWGWEATHEMQPPLGLSGVDQIASSECALALVSTGALRIKHHPVSQAPPIGELASFTMQAAGSGPWTFHWLRNGHELPGKARPMLRMPEVHPADAGIYVGVTANASNTSTSQPVILGVTSNKKLMGDGAEVGADIFHPNGNTFDQILLTGIATSITADPSQITRVSYVDLDDDIVQVEFSGPGTLTLTLDGATEPALPVNYAQDVKYVKGHASIVIAGATQDSHVSIFSVGKATAVNQALFKPEVDYDGIADVAFIAIASRDGKFGGVRAANANFFAARGVTGLYAPDVAITGPLYLGNVSAFDTAKPMILVGAASDVRITGGDLYQENGRAIQVGGLTHLAFRDGMDSHGDLIPARANRGVLQENGSDVTNTLVVDTPSPASGSSLK